MSQDVPPDVYETSNQYLTAYLMLEGFPYQAVEYRQGREHRWYSWFLFEQTEDLQQKVSAFERRAAIGNIQSFIDHLMTVKEILRRNRDQAGTETT